jgi:hypothetical protein
VRAATSAVGVFDETDGRRIVLATGTRGSVVVTPAVIVIATGRAESAEAFEGNDLPGVVSRDAADRLFAAGVLPGERAVVAGDGPAVDRLVARFGEAGARATKIARADLVRARGRSAVRLVDVTSGPALPCDVLVVEGRASACYELAAQAGVEVCFDGEVFDLVASPDDGTTRHPRVLVAGSAAGVADAAAHGTRVGAKALEVLRG